MILGGEEATARYGAPIRSRRQTRVDQVRRSICMKFLIFSRARDRSVFRFASMHIPEKNTATRSQTTSTSILGFSEAMFAFKRCLSFARPSTITLRASGGKLLSSRMEFTEKHPL